MGLCNTELVNTGLFNAGLFNTRLFNTGLVNIGGAQGRRYGGGGSEGSDDPPFLGANFLHFLYKVLEQRSVQKQPFRN